MNVAPHEEASTLDYHSHLDNVLHDGCSGTSCLNLLLKAETGNRGPRNLLDPSLHEIQLHLGHKLGKRRWVSAHDRVELSEFSRAEEDAGDPELKVGFVHAKRLEERLGEGPRVQRRKIWRKDGFVPADRTDKIRTQSR